MKNLRHIMMFGQHRMNEGRNDRIKEEVSRIQDLLETSWAEHPFCVSLVGEKNLDYNLDSEDNQHDEYSVWIEFEGVPSEKVKGLDSGYDAFVKPFLDWCKENELDNGEVSTSGDGDDITLIFLVTFDTDNI